MAESEAKSNVSKLDAGRRPDDPAGKLSPTKFVCAGDFLSAQATSRPELWADGRNRGMV
jgi:hypothetical protein